MKNLIHTILILSVVLIFSSCKKTNSTDTYFYTSRNTSEVVQSLYIDDKFVGAIPYVGNAQDQDSVKSVALTSDLLYGSHIINTKDSLGNIINSIKIEVSDSAVSTTTLIGGHSQTFSKRLGKNEILLCLF